MGYDNLIPETLHSLKRLRIAALVEGTSLFVLLGIAVPLKHFLGMPAAVSIVGPAHGLAFAFYLWTVINTAASEDWNRSKITLAVASAMLPFGAFMNAGLLLRKNGEMNR